MEKNNKQRKLIGKIILADLLKYRLEKFWAFIREVEELPFYKRLIHEGVIIRKPLSGAKILKDDCSPSSGVGVIAKIKRGSNFSIHYTHEEYSIEYVVDAMKLDGIINDVKLTEGEKENIYQLLHKLRRISTRNLITHEILKGIVEYQGDYLESNSETENELDLKLKPLRRVDLAKTTFSQSTYNTGSHSFVIDTSRISRLTEGLSIITPHGIEVSLKAFFPTKRDKVKSGIKILLDNEKREIRVGSVKKAYTDEELRHKLKDDYGLSITRRGVAYCRKDLGILPYFKRANSYGYPPLSANFSKFYPLTSSAVKNNAPTSPGVYELHLTEERIEYPKGTSQIFYIGSAKNLRKRLLDHLSGSGKNGGIKRIIMEKSCAFRYLQVHKGWIREEKNFYSLFVTTFGTPPVCNHVSPKGVARNLS
jgi:RNA polymerase sigma-54 factor